MRSHLAILFFVGSLSVTGCSPVGSIEQDEAGIVGGGTTTGWDSVVMLYNQSGGLCTGVVVADDVVATAAFCVENLTGPLDVMWCDECLVAQDTVMQTTEVHIHPSYDAMNGTAMIAAVVLPTSSPTPPMALHTTTPDLTWLGANTPLTTVGFGTTNWQANDGGTKHEVGIAFDNLDLETLQHADGTNGFCMGDGGAPVMWDDGGTWTVAGLAMASSQDCVSFGYATRMDVYASWVLSFAGTGGDDDAGDDDTVGDDDSVGDDDTVGDDDSGDDDGGDDDGGDDDIADDDVADDDTAEDDDDDTGARDCSCQTGSSPRLVPALATAFLTLCALGALYRGRSRRA